MSNLFEELANLDRLIHEPSRLSILTALATCESADFLFLQRLTGLTAGNLSSHLNKLQEAGLLIVDKSFVNKRPNTTVRITQQGREAVNNHWKRLEELHRDTQKWQPNE